MTKYDTRRAGVTKITPNLMSFFVIYWTAAGSIMHRGATKNYTTSETREQRTVLHSSKFQCTHEADRSPRRRRSFCVITVVVVVVVYVVVVDVWD